MFMFLKPVMSGAESFIAGTASCRIEVVNIDELYRSPSRDHLSGTLSDLHIGSVRPSFSEGLRARPLLPGISAAARPLSRQSRASVCMLL